MAAALVSTTAMAQTPAFPGAEGHGRYVTGGRGGKIIHVTNLKDSGEGSFRAAVNGTDKKTIVFDVGGVIPLESDIEIGENTTILGQTAPYPGITLRYRTVRPKKNTIIRFLRFRRGQEKDVNDGADCMWQRNINDLIIDHCSFSWSIDELASFYDNNNMTMQWCMLGEALANAGHGKGAHSYGGIWGGKLASFHHNFLGFMQNRVPRFDGARYNWSGYTNNDEYETYKWTNTVQAENVDFRNCVMYNWGNGNGCYGGPGGGYINIVNNYYKAGPGTSNKTRVTEISVGTSQNSTVQSLQGMASRYFITGNYVTAAGTNAANYDWNGVKYDSGILLLNGIRYTIDDQSLYGDTVNAISYENHRYVPIKLNGPAPVGEVTTHSAENAYNEVLAYAGASLFRDDVDARYVKDTKAGTVSYTGSNGTTTKGIIDIVSDCNGYTEENFPTGSRNKDFDTDQDGMPDTWETANGLNPNDASDALTYTLDSKGYYTNLEVYANAIVEDIVKTENANAENTVNEYYPTVNKADGIDYYSGIEVELINNNDSTSTGNNEGNHQETINGDKGNITYDFSSGIVEDGVIDATIAEGIASATASVGSNFTTSTQNLNGTVFNIYTPLTTQSKADETNAIIFTVTPKEGYVFQPASVSFKIVRIGTDHGKFDAAWNGKTTVLLASGERPNRKGDVNRWWTDFNTSVSAEASADAQTLVINVYDLNGQETTSPKQFGLTDIIINGTITTAAGVKNVSLSVPVGETEYYNIAGQKVNGKAKGIVIAKTRLSNGKKITRKIIL